MNRLIQKKQERKQSNLQYYYKLATYLTMVGDTNDKVQTQQSQSGSRNAQTQADTGRHRQTQVVTGRHRQQRKTVQF